MSNKKLVSIQRALEVAAELFLQRRFEDVSIKEIAAAAHCSATTIYDIYGSKDQLFVEAIAHHNRTWHAPQISPVAGDSLRPLLDYANARIRFLAHRRSRAAMRAVTARGRRIKEVEREVHEQQSYFAAVIAEIKSCISSKLLRPYGADVIAYDIIAGVAFEPTIFGQLYGDETPVHVGEIIRKVFTPLVTQAGARELAAYLDTLRDEATGSVNLPPFSAA